MGNSFIKSASKQVTDVRNFLRDSAGGNSIKYAAEQGKKHIIYIPFQTEKVVDPNTNEAVPTRSIIALQGAIHEWTTNDGKFKATVCLKDVVRRADEDDPNSPLINDGTCPFCDRITDAWDIYRYRKEIEEMNCKLTGEQRKSHLEKATRTFADERKAKEARNYMYILVVKFRTDDAGNPVIGSDGLPEYELKVMKLSSSRVEKIQQQVANTGSELPDSELIFEYPNVEDRRLLVSQSSTVPVFPNNKLVVKYPGLVDKINQDVAKFEWEGIEKSFQEWAGMTSEAAKATVESMFEQWDKYKAELVHNPQAKYLEYVVETPTTQPSIGGEGIGATANPVPAIPTIPNVPNVAAAPAPQVPNVPTVPTVPTVGEATEAPTVNANPNAVFETPGAPTAPAITI